MGSRLYSGISAAKPITMLKELEIQQVNHPPQLEDEPILVDVRSYPKFDKIEDLNASHKKMMLTIKSRKNRDKSGRILVEGKRLILDAIQSGEIPETVFFSRLDDLKDMSSLPKEGVNIFKVPYNMISLWSDVSTCPGVMGV
jgi:tRNA G18 (ribose-2'-O)-methylase SpoU